MTKQPFTDVLYEKKDGIAKITINRPEVLNALRTQTWQELRETLQDASNDAGVGVVVLTGAGDRAFSAGGDVSEQAAYGEGVKRRRELLMEIYLTIRGMDKPVIAAVNGYAIGGGNELQLFCDVTIAAEHARFGQVGPRVGLAPVFGATQLLPLTVGEKKAREIVLWCRQYNAHEAEAMGWINKVVPKEELDAEVRQWCDEILGMSPQSVKVCKASLNYFGDLAMPSFTHGMAMLDFVRGTDEQLEGARAFGEKRRPDFWARSKFRQERESERS